MVIVIRSQTRQGEASKNSAAAFYMLKQDWKSITASISLGLLIIGIIWKSQKALMGRTDDE